MYKRLFTAINPDTTVITVTRRLSNYLMSAYNTYQQNNGDEILAPADIIPIGDWLKRCWYDYVNAGAIDAPFLLSPAHEFAIWQQIIRNSPVGNRLLQFNATTELAKQAWQLAKQWQLDLDSPVFNQTEDTAAWQAWAEIFNDHSEQNNWLDTNSLPEKIIELLRRQKFNYQQKVILVGFDELNPQYQLLFKQLAAHGCVVTSFTPAAIKAQIKGIKLNDTNAEIESMARWAKQITQQHPTKLIGCIIPNLNEIRADVINIFTEVLAPAANLPGHSTSLPFNLASHTILNQYPIIRTALSLLGLYKTLEFNTVSALLRSPYLGYAEQEICARAKLDVELRKHAETFLSLRELLVAAKKYRCQHLAKLLNEYLAIIPAELTTLYPSQWAELFKQQLLVLGWPGERSLNSSEFQLVERWQELLSEFAQFDIVLNKISLGSALSHLHQIASNTLYQPQSTNTKIHLLTPLEAAGLNFDYLWLMGLQDNAWPPPANANPFLPNALQRQYKLPHASSEQELHFYQRITQQLAQSAPEIMLSYPQYNEERVLRVSALVSSITQFDDDLNLPNANSLIELVRRFSQLEAYEDHVGPALTDVEKIIGGSAIFKYQALCPFRAFAQFRLGAQALPVPHEGLNARERGSILHRTLEIIWGGLRDSKQLLMIPDAELNELIRQAVDTALLDFIKQRPHIFKEQFTKIEKARLQKIMIEWLKLEKQRPPFTVHAIEETCETQIANIPLKIRIDRIDRLADGDYVIFDYKTSLASINYWFTDRPDDPQLPLYTATSALPISGMAYALLRSNSVQFKGISANDADINGITPIDKLAADLLCNDWPTLIAQWRRVLIQLAEQYSKGQAHCDPKNGQQTCRLCDLKTLCRISEQNNMT